MAAWIWIIVAVIVLVVVGAVGYMCMSAPVAAPAPANGPRFLVTITPPSTVSAATLAANFTTSQTTTMQGTSIVISSNTISLSLNNTAGAVTGTVMTVKDNTAAAPYTITASANQTYGINLS